MDDVQIHPTAIVSPRAEIGAGTRIWHHAHVREGARLGSECIVGKSAYIDRGVQIGNRVKIQNYSLIYRGATLEDGVFVGPYVCFTYDTTPRAITPLGQLKGAGDWEVGSILVCYGASLGAGVMVLPGVTIGRWSMVGAGAVVTRDVPDFGLVVGQPAQLTGYVCRCGKRLISRPDGSRWCADCREAYRLGKVGV
jgi:UDP-2-acetamido-3-amino-2,3-dideoxy-glucuronate N-acetyltransferase